MLPLTIDDKGCWRRSSQPSGRKMLQNGRTKDGGQEEDDVEGSNVRDGMNRTDPSLRKMKANRSSLSFNTKVTVAVLMVKSFQRKGWSGPLLNVCLALKRTSLAG